MKRNYGQGILDEFLENGRLSSSLMLLKLTNIIKEAIKEIDGKSTDTKTSDQNTKRNTSNNEDVKVSTKRPGYPAVTLVIGNGPSSISVDIVLGLESQRQYWCNSTKNGLDIESWLGSKTKQSFLREPLYVVPKNVKEGRSFIANTCRLSFSCIEKLMLNNHGCAKTCCKKGGLQCCRKNCLKLLKYLLEQLKTKYENRNPFDKFCSYQVKTAFLHACAKWPRDDEWLPANLDEF